MVSPNSLFAVRLTVVLLGLLNIYLAITLRRHTTEATRQYSKNPVILYTVFAHIFFPSIHK